MKCRRAKNYICHIVSVIKENKCRDQSSEGNTCKHQQRLPLLVEIWVGGVVLLKFPRWSYMTFISKVKKKDTLIDF